MSISNKIEYIATEQLNLDPKNPRLRRSQHGLSQEELLEVMTDWVLDELAASIVENGFWAHEPLLVVFEKLTSKAENASIVVVEGNRRLAAVRLLLKAYEGKPLNQKWEELASDLTAVTVENLKYLPTIEASERRDVDVFIGFRNLTGIKQWEPREKAAFIAKFVDSGLSYEEVARQIGIRASTVRQNYVAFRLLRQLEELEDVAAEKAHNKFSVLFLSLRSSGTQEYLGIDVNADPENASKPLKPEYQPNAVRFARWLFGDDTHEPLFTDSRHTDRFGLILANKEARAYLERTEEPRFEVALRLSGGDRVEVIRRVERAADEIEEVLSVVHHYSDDPDLIEATKRLFKDIETLAGHFPQSVGADKK
jgi:transcriptional regulator with XRE-family HTH domain